MHPRLREEGTSCRFTLVKSKSASSTPSTAQARFHGLQPISYCTDPSSSFRSWPVPKDLLDPTQNPTSSSLPKLLYNASMSSPAKESEPANINVSAISKSSASNGNLLQSHRGGNNSPEKKKNTQLSIALCQPQRLGQTAKEVQLQPNQGPIQPNKDRLCR